MQFDEFDSEFMLEAIEVLRSTAFQQRVLPLLRSRRSEIEGLILTADQDDEKNRGVRKGLLYAEGLKTKCEEVMRQRREAANVRKAEKIV